MRLYVRGAAILEFQCKNVCRGNFSYCIYPITTVTVAATAANICMYVCMYAYTYYGGYYITQAP